MPLNRNNFAPSQGRSSQPASHLDRQDRKTFSLEDQIDEIVIVFEECLKADRLRNIEEKRERRLSIRAGENRRLAEQRRKREDERDALIGEIVQLQAKARDLSAWIDWAAPIEDPETKRMLDGACKRLASIERAVKPVRFGDWLREKSCSPKSIRSRRCRVIWTSKRALKRRWRTAVICR